jgi:RTX calcium-binding nonapeptide repeat (4 copies)
MATDPILLRAILAMDAYNRGYAAGIKDLGGEGSQIGEAILGKDATQLLAAGAAQATGFYAAAYTLSDGSKVISFRGTDQNLPGVLAGTVFGSDFLNGYGLGVGSPGSVQTIQALEFYRSVSNGVDPRTADIALTGHSLGGGLAGLIGALYGKSASLFDNMPFQAGVFNAFQLSLENYLLNGPGPLSILHAVNSTQLRSDIYGNLEPWLPAGAQTSGAYVLGEFLQLARAVSLQAGPLTQLDSYAGVSDPFHKLHSIALLVELLWAQENNKTDWQAVGNDLWNAYFSENVASALGLETLRGENNTVGGVMRDIISYSAVDVGSAGHPFGDSAIRALFDDADQLGKLYTGAHNAILDSDAPGGSTVKAALTEIAVQYAGDLAKQGATDADSKAGVFELVDGDNVLKAEFDPEKWQATFNKGDNTGGQEKIVGLIDLADAVRETVVSESPAKIQQAIYDATIDWKPDGAAVKDVTLLEFAAKNVAVSLDATDAVTAHSGHDGGAILLGGDKSDTLTGGKGSDLLIGGKGNDNFFDSGAAPGSQSDVLFGGDGKDVFTAAQLTGSSTGNVTFFGGAGNQDTADFSALTSNLNIELSSTGQTAEQKAAGMIPVNYAGQGRTFNLFETERVILTEYSDTITIKEMRAEQLKDLKYIDGGSEEAFGNGDTIDISALSGQLRVDLKNANDNAVLPTLARAE